MPMQDNCNPNPMSAQSDQNSNTGILEGIGSPANVHSKAWQDQEHHSANDHRGAGPQDNLV